MPTETPDASSGRKQQAAPSRGRPCGSSPAWRVWSRARVDVVEAGPVEGPGDESGEGGEQRARSPDSRESGLARSGTNSSQRCAEPPSPCHRPPSITP